MTSIRHSYDIKPIFLNTNEKSSRRLLGEVVNGQVIDKNDKGTQVFIDGYDVMVDASVGIVEEVGTMAKFEVIGKTNGPLALRYLGPSELLDDGSSLGGQNSVKPASVQNNYHLFINQAVKKLSENDQQKIVDMIQSTNKSLTETVDHLTDKDVKQMMQDGLNVERTSMEVIARVLSNNKAAINQGDISLVEEEVNKAVESLKKDNMDAPVLKDIVSALKAADVPVKKKHVDKMLSGLDILQQIRSANSEEAIKLLKGDYNNGEAVTLSSVYKVLSSPTPQAEVLPISDEALQGLVEERLAKEGISVTAESIEAAKSLVRHGVDLRADTIAFVTAPEKVMSQMTDQKLIEQMAGRISNHEDVKDVPLDALMFLKEGLGQSDESLNNGISQGSVASDQSKQSLVGIIDLIGKTTDAHIVQAVRLSQTKNLDQVLSVVASDGSISREEVGDKQEALSSSALKELATSVDLKWQMEEIRLKMTLEVAVRLEKQGIKVATAPLDQVVEALKEEASNLHDAQLKAYGPELTEENQQIYKQTMNQVTRLKVPDVNMAANVIKDQRIMTIDSLQAISQDLKGASISDAYNNSMTEIRPDLGDKIEKTFDQIGPILDELGLEKTESHIEAVEILARNGMAVTEENILSIEILQEKIGLVTEKMTPVVVMKMIQADINPMTLDIEELLGFMQAYEEESSLGSEDKISQLIYKLDASDTLSQEERTSLMAMYRTFDTVVRSKGAATGFLVKNNLPLTINELFEAAKYLRKTQNTQPAIEASINDDFGPLEMIENKELSIREQVKAAMKSLEASPQANKQWMNTSETSTIVEALVRQEVPVSGLSLLKSELMNLRIEQFVQELSGKTSGELVEELDNPTNRALPLETLTALMKDWTGKTASSQSIEQQMDQYQAFIKANPEVLKSFVEQQIPMTFENFSKAMTLNEDSFSLINDLESMIHNIKDASVKEAALDKLTTTANAVLRGEQPYEALKTALEDVDKLIQNSSLVEDSGIYKASQSAKANVDHVQMIQVSEDYYQIPVMMDGQMSQLNMFFMNENESASTKVDSMKVLMSFSTEQMGRVQALVTVEGNQASLHLQSSYEEDQILLQKVEAEFLKVLEASNFTLSEVSYEPFEVKEPVMFEARQETKVNRVSSNGHIDWTI